MGPASNVLFQATFYCFASDLVDRHDGNETDLLAQARFGRTMLTARYADYRANAFATDTRKLWVQADWAF